MGHLGESQGHAQVPSPFELTPKTQIESKGKQSPEKERSQNLGFRKPPPLRMNLVLEIQFIGKTVLGRQSLKIPLVSRLPLPRCEGLIEPYGTISLCCELLSVSHPTFLSVSPHMLNPWQVLSLPYQSFTPVARYIYLTVRHGTHCVLLTILEPIPTDKQLFQLVS